MHTAKPDKKVLLFPFYRWGNPGTARLIASPGPHSSRMTQSSLAGGHSRQGIVTLLQLLSASRIPVPAAVPRSGPPLKVTSGVASPSHKEATVLMSHLLGTACPLTQRAWLCLLGSVVTAHPSCRCALPPSWTVTLGTAHELNPAQCPRRCLDRTTQPCPPKSKASTPPRFLHIAHIGTPPVALRLLRDSCPQPRHKAKWIGLPVQVNTSDLRSLSLGLSWQSKG